jgi:hypothetical protein
VGVLKTAVNSPQSGFIRWEVSFVAVRAFAVAPLEEARFPLPSSALNAWRDLDSV